MWDLDAFVDGAAAFAGRGSRVPTLDQECIRAFTAAAPFPNPPPHLFENNLWAFDFTFEFEVRSPEQP